MDRRSAGAAAAPPAHFGKLVGRSESMRRVFAALQRSADTDVSVLIEGERGTGKEVAAEAIHRASSRGRGPFVLIECGAAPMAALRAELFGKDGAFQSAQHGTLLLDEVGALDLDLQADLLGAIDASGADTPASDTYMPFDVRLMAATTRNLQTAIAENRFRADLLCRLAVVKVKLPPLREHLEDLPILVDHVLDNLGISQTAEARSLRSPPFLADLARCPWPGNVRQLRNHLERCAALGEALPPEQSNASRQDATPTASGGLTVDVSQPLALAREGWVAAFERRYLAELLAQHGYDVGSAARGAGVDRMQLHRLLRKHGLSAQQPAGGKR